MAYEEYCRRIEHLKHLIKRECTGNANELAKILGISRSTLYNYLGTLQDEGNVIKFDVYRKTYYSDNL